MPPSQQLPLDQVPVPPHVAGPMDQHEGRRRCHLPAGSALVTYVFLDDAPAASSSPAPRREATGRDPDSPHVPSRLQIRASVAALTAYQADEYVRAVVRQPPPTVDPELPSGRAVPGDGRGVSACRGVRAVPVERASGNGA